MEKQKRKDRKEKGGRVGGERENRILERIL